MTTNDERRGLTEPLESVTTFFGALMIIAALIGVAFLVFGSDGTYGGLPGSVCVTNPGTEYGGDWHTSAVPPSQVTRSTSSAASRYAPITPRSASRPSMSWPR